MKIEDFVRNYKELTDSIQREDLTGVLAELADVLGLEATRELFIAWRGCRLEIPSVLPMRTKLRYTLNATKKGRTLQEIAQTLCVNEHTARRFLQEAETLLEGPKSTETAHHGLSQMELE